MRHRHGGREERGRENSRGRHRWREDVERDQEAWNPGRDGACRDTHPETNGHKDTWRGLRGAGGRETHRSYRKHLMEQFLINGEWWTNNKFSQIIY